MRCFTQLLFFSVCVLGCGFWRFKRAYDETSLSARAEPVAMFEGSSSRSAVWHGVGALACFLPHFCSRRAITDSILSPPLSAFARSISIGQCGTRTCLVPVRVLSLSPALAPQLTQVTYLETPFHRDTSQAARRSRTFARTGASPSSSTRLKACRTSCASTASVRVMRIASLCAYS